MSVILATACGWHFSVIRDASCPIHVMVQFITLVEVPVIMRGAISCEQILSSKLGCLVVLLRR